MIRSTIACVVLTVFAAQAVHASTDTFTSIAQDYCIDMPGKVTEKTEVVEGIKLHMAKAVSSDGAVYSVGSYFEPIALVLQSQRDEHDFMKRLARKSYDGVIYEQFSMRPGLVNASG